MKINITTFFILSVILSSCTYNIVRSYNVASNFQHNENAKPLIVKQKNLIGLDVKYLGTIKLDDGGLTINCSEDEAIKILESEASLLNSNLINITQELYSGNSTCYRCVADLYFIEFDSLSQKILNNTERLIIKHESINRIKWSDFNTALSDSSLVPYVFYSNIEIESGGASFWDGAFKDFTAQGVFYSDVSGVKSSFISDSNLVHVQLQYDLTQLYVKKLEQYLNSDNFKSGNNEKVQNVLNQHLHDLFIEQNKYMKETDYGSNFIAQKIWIEKISNELQQIKNE